MDRDEEDEDEVARMLAAAIAPTSESLGMQSMTALPLPLPLPAPLEQDGRLGDYVHGGSVSVSARKISFSAAAGDTSFDSATGSVSSASASASGVPSIADLEAGLLAGAGGTRTSSSPVVPLSLPLPSRRPTSTSFHSLAPSPLPPGLPVPMPTPVLGAMPMPMPIGQLGYNPPPSPPLFSMATLAGTGAGTGAASGLPPRAAAPLPLPIPLPLSLGLSAASSDAAVEEMVAIGMDVGHGHGHAHAASGLSPLLGGLQPLLGALDETKGGLSPLMTTESTVGTGMSMGTGSATSAYSSSSSSAAAGIGIASGASAGSFVRGAGHQRSLSLGYAPDASAGEPLFRGYGTPQGSGTGTGVFGAASGSGVRARAGVSRILQASFDLTSLPSAHASGTLAGSSGGLLGLGDQRPGDMPALSLQPAGLTASTNAAGSALASTIRLTSTTGEPFPSGTGSGLGATSARPAGAFNAVSTGTR